MTPPSIRFRAVQPSYRVELPPPQGSGPSVLAFSHNKAGSSMFYRVLAGLCPSAGLSFVSIPGLLFQRGVAPRAVTVETEFSETGHCYGGYRFFPDSPIPLLETARTALLVRDPRDVLVSHYHSIRESHPLPGPDGDLKRQLLARRAQARAISIDAWVVQNHGAVVQSLSSYVAQRFLSRPNVAVYRYEDVVFRKREWIVDLVSWYGWEVPQSVIERVLAEVDVFPQLADPSKHIRQVRPGNFRTALSPATQEILTEQLEMFLRLFNYDGPAGTTAP